MIQSLHFGGSSHHMNKEWKSLEVFSVGYPLRSMVDVAVAPHIYSFLLLRRQENCTSLRHGSSAWPRDYFDQWNISGRIRCPFRWKHLKPSTQFSMLSPILPVLGWQHQGMEMFPSPASLSTHDEQIAHPNTYQTCNISEKYFLS